MRQLITLIAIMTWAATASAAPRGAVDSSNKPDLSKAAADQREADDLRAATINRIEAYLSNINSVVADFTQTSSDGSMGTGKFFLKRPGKMRWQYDKPNPILLISDGKTITYYDAGLDQVSYVGVDDTLAGFIARKNIQLESESTKVTHYASENGVISVTIVQAKKPGDGSLTLEFTDKPLEIKRLISVDATGNETRVSLQNASFGPVVDDKLFVFDDTRSVNRKRNKK